MDMTRKIKIACIADMKSKVARESFDFLVKRYGLLDGDNADLEDVETLVVLGGDGMMLKVLHKHIGTNTKIYGLNRGSVGFLMNQYAEENLFERIKQAVEFRLYPLEMTVTTTNGKIHKALAINEVSLLRETNQAAKINIYIDDKEQLESLVCDGILVSTPAGSTAYNFAANGPIIPLNSNILALTPISPFRPRRWRGALLSNSNKIKFEIINPDKRPVSAVADFIEFRDIKTVEVCECRSKPLSVLFDQQDSIADRIVKEQFMP